MNIKRFDIVLYLFSSIRILYSSDVKEAEIIIPILTYLIGASSEANY